MPSFLPTPNLGAKFRPTLADTGHFGCGWLVHWLVGLFACFPAWLLLSTSTALCEQNY